jgi:CheY-like chemotaxis protein
MESIETKQSPLIVMPLGFETAVIERLRSIFQSPCENERCYCVASANSKEGVAVLLVNYDNPDALNKKTQLLDNSYPNAFVIAVSQGPLANAPLYHIRGMLTATRLLTLLDKIPVVAPKPIVTPVPIVPAPVITNTTTPSSVAKKGYCALIVDDSVAIQKSLELKLASLQQITQIDFADSGEMALEKAESKQYDLIFLDVMMPGIDGYETCTRLRKKPEYKKTPIIMVSGKSSPLDEVKGVIAGCTTYLIKPVQDEAFSKLSMRVLVWLGERSAN